MEIKREWAMPSKHTFTMKPIKSWLKKIMKEYPGIYAEPFCGEYGLGDIKNDLNPNIKADFHLESQEFVTQLSEKTFDHVIFDPPYSPRQCKEIYESVGLSYCKEKNQQSVRHSKCKDILASKMDLGSITVSFGWNSTGFGRKRGFEILKILLVNHGSAHNDTICVVEKMKFKQETLF